VGVGVEGSVETFDQKATSRIAIKITAKMTPATTNCQCFLITPMAMLLKVNLIIFTLGELSRAYKKSIKCCVTSGQFWISGLNLSVRTGHAGCCYTLICVSTGREQEALEFQSMVMGILKIQA
jgi:hypothetical protein